MNGMASRRTGGKPHGNAVRERDNTLDAIKAVAIVLVCSYHAYYLEKEGFAYVALYSLCSMGVPLFFFVNGALLFTPP